MNTPNENIKQTLVEEGTDFQGTIRSSCHVVVNGSIDGQIEAPSLTVTGTGTVLGTVKAKKLHSEGTLAGDIDADDVYLSGVVRSNTMIRARKLEVKLAPERGKLEVTFGECLIEVGEDPAVIQEPETTAAATTDNDVTPLAAASSSSPGNPENETGWSEPPPLQVEESSSGESASAKDSAARRPKRNHQRDSQAPMA